MPEQVDVVAVVGEGVPEDPREQDDGAPEAEPDAEDVEVVPRLRVELLVREPDVAEAEGLGVSLLQRLRQRVQPAVVGELEVPQLRFGWWCLLVW